MEARLQQTSDRAIEASNAAARVFNIVELLEMVIEHAALPEDIMALRQVSRGIRTIVDNSKRLKLRPLQPCFERHGYLWHGEMHLRGCPKTMPSYFRCLGSLPKHYELLAVLYFNHDKRPPENISKYGNCPMSLPPPKRLTVIVSTTQAVPNVCTGHWTPAALLATDLVVGIISSSYGLFLGDLYDSAEQMISRYENKKRGHGMDYAFMGRPERGWAVWFVAEAEASPSSSEDEDL